MTTERPAGLLREAAQAVVDFLAPQPFPGGNALLPQALYNTPVINDLRDALAALHGPDGLDVERLARAIVLTGIYLDEQDGGIAGPDDLAQQIAAEYAALPATPDTGKGET